MSYLRIWFTVLLISAMQTFSMNAGANENKLSYDFGQQGCGECGWFVVLDGVMGGLSTGKLESVAKALVLSGNISLQNNGGFASIRTPYRKFDLSRYSEVTVRYRSKGQTFAMSLNNYRRFWRPQFKTFLPPTNGKWAESVIPLRSFTKMRFDEVLGGGPSAEELASIIRFGFISSDKSEGEFRFEISGIEFR